MENAQEGVLVGQLVMQFADYLQIGLESPEQSIVKLSARAIGHLSRIAQGHRDMGASVIEGINSQIVQACDVWANPTQYVSFSLASSLSFLGLSNHCSVNASRRMAAVLVLARVSKHSPILFFVHLKRFLEVIWFAVTGIPISYLGSKLYSLDNSIDIRLKASKAISHCLQFIQQRGNKTFDWQLMFWLPIRKVIYTNIGSLFSQQFFDPENTKSPHEPGLIHGYLTVLGEILLHTGTFMRNVQHFTEASIIVFSNMVPILSALLMLFRTTRTKPFIRRSSLSCPVYPKFNLTGL